MQQTVYRYTDAEVLEHLVRGTHMNAAIRHLYQMNFKPLSNYILQHKGSWRDVRAQVPFVMTQMAWLVQREAYPAGAGIQSFLLSLNEAMWQNELSRRMEGGAASEGSEAVSPAVADVIQKAAEEKNFYASRVHCFEELSKNCKEILLQYYDPGRPGRSLHPETAIGKAHSGSAHRYGCLKKLEQVLVRSGHMAPSPDLPPETVTHYQERLLQFAEGILSPKEETGFQKELEQNRALQEEASRLALEIGVVKYYGLWQIVSAVQREFLLEYPSSPTRKRSRVVFFKRLVRVALAIAAIVLLVALLMAGNYFFQLSTDKLYDEAYVEYPISVSPRKDATPITIEEAYRQQNYAAVKKMSKKKRGYTDREYLLIGLSFLHLNDASSAIEPLRWVTIWPGSSYKPDAEYYLAMAYLKDKDYDKAMEVMQSIHSNPDHLYHDQFPKEYIRKVRLLKWR